VGKSKCPYVLTEMSYFITWNNPGHLVCLTEFCGTSGAELYLNPTGTNGIPIPVSCCYLPLPIPVRTNYRLCRCTSQLSEMFSHPWYPCWLHVYNLQTSRSIQFNGMWHVSLKDIQSSCQDYFLCTDFSYWSLPSSTGENRQWPVTLQESGHNAGRLQG
jgi:hypothetical protein